MAEGKDKPNKPDIAPIIYYNPTDIDGGDDDDKTENKNNFNETKGEKESDIGLFLQGKGLSKYEDVLINEGLENTDLLNELDDEMINEIMKDANIKKLHQKVLRKAIKDFKNGIYKPVPYDPFKELREERKDLKGYISKTADEITGATTKTIIFIGQTGVGKTTFINSMCNYLYQVSYEEKFRYKLICEENDTKVDTKDQTKSQTQVITKYHLEHLPAIENALTIVDTPGFGDTQGPKKDMEIRNKFKEFFEENCPFIDGVYFIIKSSDTRVGAVQQYIFNMVLDLFGEDIKENIFILFTFSDGAEPPALKAVEKLGINYAKYFTINNSGFDLPLSKGNMFHQQFFNVGMDQFKIVFNELAKIKTKSTKKTAETLKERENITTGLKKIGEKLKLQLDKANERNKTIEDLQRNKEKIEANKNFKVRNSVTVKYREKVSHKWWTTYCCKCDWTCCDKCFAQMVTIRMCYSFKKGNCTICDDKCSYLDHKHADFIVKQKEVVKYMTMKDMAKKYKLGQGQKVNYENVMQKVNEDINKIEKDIKETIIKMKKSVQRLQEIALNKNNLTNEEYFDMLITAEKTDRKKGWQERVMELQKMKDDYKKLTQVIHDSGQNEESIMKKWVNETMGK